jgi:hypothetical protein
MYPEVVGTFNAHFYETVIKHLPLTTKLLKSGVSALPMKYVSNAIFVVSLSPR